MRIAVFTDTFLPSTNGIVTSIANSTKILAKKGHKIIIFTTKPADNSKIKLEKNIKLVHCNPTGFVKYPGLKLSMPNIKIINQLRKFKPNVIHTHTPTPLGWEALLCGKMFSIPVVSTYHTLLPDFLMHTSLPKKIQESSTTRKFVWSYTRGYYNMCDLVISPSDTIKHILEDHGITRPIRTLSNGVDHTIFRPKNLKKNNDTILHVGRISQEKNIAKIINAFKIVNTKLPKTKLLIAGSGPDMKYLKKISGNLLDKSIFFLGKVDHKKLPELYSKADVFVTASEIETEGLVILEAMSCGLPIVGVGMLAVPEIVEHLESGIVCKPGSTTQIAEGIVSILKNSELKKKYATRSLEITENYSLKKTATKLEKIYSTLSK